MIQLACCQHIYRDLRTIKTKVFKRKYGNVSCSIDLEFNASKELLILFVFRRSLKGEHSSDVLYNTPAQSP